MNVKNLVRPWLHSLEPYPPGKPIDELEREYGITDSIKLASNENPLGPSPKALAAIQSAIPDIHRYPDGNRRTEVQEIRRAFRHRRRQHRALHRRPYRQRPARAAKARP